MKDGNYWVRLTDGFLQTKGRNRGMPTNVGSLEIQLAERLLQSACIPHAAEDGEQLYPRSLHVWVVGSDGWQRRPLGMFQNIAESENNDSYRVVIIGEDIQGRSKPFYAAWQSWLRLAGMTRKKMHADNAKFRKYGDALLGIIGDHYNEHRSDATSLLRRLGKPITFAGYSDWRADSTPSYRIQQYGIGSTV